MEGYRKALYYPYIHIKDDNWLKTAALFYDGLCRIKPDDYTTRDSDAAKELSDELGFIEDASPKEASQQIEQPFLRYALDNLGDHAKRAELNPELRDAIETDSEIYGEKVLPQVAKKLEELGLMKEPKREGWYNFEPSAAAVYMTFLANAIAEQKGISVVTDDPAYTPFLFGAKGYRITETYAEIRKDPSFMLSNLVLRERLPDKQSVSDTSIKDIIRFRKKHDGARCRFMNAISEFVKPLSSANSEPDLKYSLNVQHSKVESAVKEYKAALRGTKIKFGSTLIGLSFPAWLGHFGAVLPLTNVPIAFGSIMVGAAYLTAKVGESGYEYYRIQSTSPWSYVHALEKKFGRRRQFQTLEIGLK